MATLRDYLNGIQNRRDPDSSLTQPLGGLFNPQTAAEIAASVTPTDYSFQTDPNINIKRYGAKFGNSIADNLAALNKAILVAKNSSGALSGVSIVIPADCPYGYKATDSTTWPQNSGSIPITIIDYSQGSSYSGYPIAYDGAQVRYFFYTPQTTRAITFTSGIAGGATSATLSSAWANLTGPWIVIFSNGDVRYANMTNGLTSTTWTTGLTSAATANALYQNSGQHDGNAIRIRGTWNPGLVIDNDAKLPPAGSTTRTVLDNRRAQVSYSIDGAVSWIVGQGTLNGAGLTDEELCNFIIEKIQLPSGDTIGSYGSLLIERKTGNISMGNATNVPQASLHVISPSSSFYQGMFENTFSTLSEIVLRNSNGSADDVILKNNAGQAAITIIGQGDAIRFDKANRRTTFGASVQQKSIIVTYSASMAIDSTLGNVFIITANNGSAFSIAAPSGSPTQAMELTIRIHNTSGGALGAATFSSSAGGYKMAAWTQPATGFNRSITFIYDITADFWYESSRTSSDIPN